MHFLDKHVSLISDLVYQVFEVPSIDFRLPEASQSSLCNAPCHLGLANDENIVLENLIPQLILNVDWNIRSQHMVIAIVLQLLCKHTIGHVERIQTGL